MHDINNSVDVIPPIWSNSRRSNFQLRETGFPESVKLTKVDIDWPPMQTCTVCNGAGCDDGLR